MRYLAAFMLTVACAASAGDAQSLQARIRTTSYGVPHVLGRDFASAGFGLGYAVARDNICEIAPTWVTVNARRSFYFGPDQAETRGAAAGTVNLDSDFFWKRILDAGIVEKELARPAPLGPTAEVRALVRGYAAGYNRYLRQVGVDKLPDPRCRGAAWVRPINEKDIYLRAMQWNLTLGSGGLIKDLLKPRRPAKDASAAADPARSGAAAGMFEGRREGLGSNVIALGRAATDNGRGMLFANPHWFWDGPDRWSEAQLTVPGKMNVYGAVGLGLPVVLIGHTDKVAWSHTLSTPKRYTIYELKLAPGDPTAYLYDGKPRKMTPRLVTVNVREKDGRTGQRSHTFWETHFGPLVGTDQFGWTDQKAFAVRDATYSFRWLNQQLDMNRARSVDDMERAGLRHLAIGWLNTVAADSAGNAYFADRSAVPNVSDAMLVDCVTSELGNQLLAAQRLPVLDGWRSACEWGRDADAPIDSILGPDHLPELLRDDYATNSNDSYWVNNLRQPLEGFPLILGDERTPRSLRTRIGLLKIERRLDGSDGLPGKGFTLDQLESVTMDNRVLTAELWRDDVLRMCRDMAPAKLPREACEILAKWDGTENLDSPGIVLWRRFFENLSPKVAFLGSRAPGIYSVPFDPADPMNTPRGLNIANPRVRQALVTAVEDLRSSRVPLDATYRTYQYEERNGVRIPIPGGAHGLGQYNLNQNAKGWVPGDGWPDIALGASFVMWTQFTPEGPRGRSVLAFSQSSDPTSPYHADQTRLFSEGKSKPMLFHEGDIMADPNLKIEDICASPNGAGCNARTRR